MRRLEATFDVTTPIFSARSPDDSREGRVELRPASIKGVLRFWWRALAWQAFADHLKAGGDDDMPRVMQAIHRAEGWLFGAAGRTVSRVRILPPEVLAADYPSSFTDCVSQFPYLGYGLGRIDGRNGVPSKPARVPLKVSSFAMPVLVDDRRREGGGVSQDEAGIALDLVPKAIKAWGLLGGIGAKARRGFGSLSLRTLREGENILFAANDGLTLEQYEEHVRSVLPVERDSDLRPPYSAFSSGAGVTVCIAHDSAKKVLLEAGYAMQHYRIYGFRLKDRQGHHLWVPKALRPGATSLTANQAAGDGLPAWQRSFEDDHDRFYGSDRPACPRRAVFGLPHNYPKRNRYVIGALGNGNRINRRASPLSLHVHRLRGNVFVLVAVLLQPHDDWFLPPEGEMRWATSPTNGGNRFSAGWSVDWAVLRGFVEHLAPAGAESRPRRDAGIAAPKVERGLQLPLELLR